MNTLILITLCGSSLLIVYHHAGYPMILRLFRSLANQKIIEPLIPHRYRNHQLSDESENVNNGKQKYQSITIVVPAYNEQLYISEKLKNLACMDYPINKIKIVIACDGCSDRTVHVARMTARSLSHVNIEIKNFEKNRGKCAVLNDVLSSIDTDLVAFSDVSSLISLDALNVCNLRFRDKQVGGINGNYRMLNATNAGEENYWHYQRNIKLGEQSLGSLLGAHGAFYVIRTKLFKTLPVDTINDDFIIPMRVIEQGYKVIYDSRVNAVELEVTSNEDNWNRRKRIGFGNAQQLIILKSLLHPKYKGVAFAFISGKGLRVLMPFLMIYALFASLYCAFIWSIFIPVFLVQLAIYLIALFVESHQGNSLGKIPNTIHYLITGHAANLLGSLNYLTRSKTHW